MRFDIFRTLWTLTNNHVLLRSYLANRPFQQGFASGVAYGLISIATLSSVALFFEMLALIYGGDSNTLWQIIGLIFSLPWPGLFAAQNQVIPWIFGGIVINLLLLGFAWGIYKLIQARRNV